MDEAQEKEFKKQIVTIKLELVELLQHGQTETVQLDQSRVGRLSRMDALQGQQMALEAQRRNEQKIMALDGALRRMEAGDFGYCFVCGDEIPLPRLQIDPTVTRCINCTNVDPEN